jgi:two-component system, cell cycle sensor histidine kinase and response regulator CckA
MPSQPPKDAHSLLARQLRRSQVDASSLDEATNKLLDVINSAYRDFDSSRQMLERSLDLSSQELMRANAELRGLLAERHAAEKQMELLHAQRLEATGLLAGGVAHDFNNLLAVIKGSCEVLLKLTDPGDARGEIARQIETATARATTLTRQLLAFSRGQVLEPRVIDLNRTITGLEHICRPLLGGDIELRWSLDPQLPAINADPAQIEQVLVNLIVNARDAMPSGGTLELQTTRASGDEARAHEASNVPLVRLSVKDSGSGMSSAVKSRIFEPFFTTKAPGKGTGLGLSTVYGIVRQSGGFITVESEVAKGTTFHVFLPESETSHAAAQ